MKLFRPFLASPGATKAGGAAQEKERANWPTRAEKDTPEWGARQAQALWDNLYARYKPSIDRRVVLDLGCSWGYMLKFLADNFQPARLIGTDVRPHWLTIRQAWNYEALSEKLEFHAGDLPALPIASESVDLILCTSVLQYMTPEQMEANLTRCFELLRPGGQMLLRTRVFTSYIGADLHRTLELPYAHMFYGEDTLAHAARRRGRSDPPYLNWLTASTYAAIFVRTGFEIIDFRRRPNKHAPEVIERVRKAYPWISEEELLCAEVEAQLTRPLEPEDLKRFANARDQQNMGAAADVDA